MAAFAISALTAQAQFVFQPLTEADSKDIKIYNHVPNLSLNSDLMVTWHLEPGEAGEPDTETLFQSFLEFNLSGLQISGDQVTGATLELYAPALNGAGTVGLFLITSPWTESGTNFLNSPTFSTLIDSVFIDQAAQTYSFDVTSAVQSWASGELPNYGFAIRMMTQGGDVTLADVDAAGAEHAPKLTVVPEPSSALATLCGCALLGSMRRRNWRTSR